MHQERNVSELPEPANPLSAAQAPSNGTAEVEARLLRALEELSVSAGRSLDPVELVKLVADRTCDVLAADVMALYLWDEGAEVLRPVYFTNEEGGPPPAEYTLRLGEGAVGQAVQRRETVLVSDYQNYGHAVPWLRERNVQAVEAVPLLVADRAIGALAVGYYQRREVRPEEQRALSLLAAQVAPALEAARLYVHSQREHQRERVLREITQALAVNREEREVLRLAVQYSATLLEAPYARVWIREPNEELSCAAAEGYVHVGTFQRRLSPESISGRGARQRILNLANAPVDPSWEVRRDFGAQTGLGAYLGAGLWRAGESLGVLEVMGPTGRRFTSAEEQLLATLANAVAVAVSNARTQAAVAESELLLRSVYEAIGSGVLVLDARERVIDANGAAEEILGRSRTALLGMHSAQFRPAVREDGSPQPEEDRPWAVAVRSRSAVRKLVLGINGPEEQRRWLQVDAVPLSGADGDITRVIVSFIDITERRRSEEALRQRDAILEAVAFAAEQLLSTDHWEQSIDAVLCRLGAGLGVSRVYIVPAGLETALHAPIYEWTADAIPPRVVPPGGANYLEALGLSRWQAILSDGGIVQGRVASFPDDERHVLEREGARSVIGVPIFAGHAWWGFIGFDDCRTEREWGDGTVEVLRTAAGTLGAAILRGRAEAERLQLVSEQAARAEAEAAQERLALLAGASHLLATSLDYEATLQSVAGLVVPYLADYCVVDMRQPDGGVRRIALANAAVQVDPGTELAGAEHHVDPSGSHPVAQVLRTGKPLLFPRLNSPVTPEWVRTGLASEPVAARPFTSGMLVPLETRGGTAGVLTCLAWGQRRAYDLRDLSLAQDLARRCALAIDNATLYREAREAISIRDEFLSVAAHELKTPMTSLRGYAQLLGREFERGDVPNPERARRAATTIQVQADKLARLVAQLLDISRLESGKLAIERKPTNFSQLVREVVDAARPQLKDHALVALLPEELWLSVDPLRMEQVVTNLVDNAIKYSPEGGRIDVTLQVDEERGAVRLAIRDRGVGVPMEHRAHIFDRFYQAHAGGPLTSMAGMGLGLYISRQIVELHGGTIVAEFPAERGTIFVVTLPLQAREARQSATPPGR